MKILIILMTTCLMQVSASTYAQRISLSEKNASLISIFQKINKQSGVSFLVSNELLAGSKTVNIKVKDEELDDVLETIFEGQPLSYELKDKVVIVSRKEPSFLDNIIARFQAIDIRGKIVDEKGEGLPGATVKVKGSGKIVLTDAKGGFYITNVKEDEVLVITYTGYLMREVNANGDLSAVVLEMSNSKLDEVQIMAYGTTSQRLNTGNIVSIKAADIEKQPVNNPLFALQGRVAGLQVTPTTGLAGGIVNIQIRGKNTIREGENVADPLIVLDGLPIQNNITGLGGNNIFRLSSLSFINLNDIESIDILKDADATSIYGSRGANGVILITTKKGKIGEVKIDLNLQSGIANVPKKLELLNTHQYLQLRREAYANAGLDLTNSPLFFGRADVVFWDQNRYTDWQKELIGKNATYQDANGSVSGGTNTLQYYFGGNFHRETTVFPGENANKKGGAHFSLISRSANDKFNGTINASYQSDNNTLPGIDLTNQSILLSPNAPSIYQADGTLNWELFPTGGRSWDNPYAQLSKTYDASINNLVASADINYKVLPSLMLKMQLGYNKLQGSSFIKVNPFAGRNPEALNDRASSQFQTNGSNSLSVEPQIMYNAQFGKSKLSALVGASLQNNYVKNQIINASGFTSDALMQNLQSATDFGASNSAVGYRYNAVFGRINYNLEDEILMNLTGRRDGSSRFGPGKQFGNFGSIGAAWIFTQREFFKKNIPVMSFGKLRFSYGSSGNDGIGDYAYLERYEAVEGTDTYQGVRGYRTVGVINPYYAWEVTRKMEIGLETGFFNDRILFTGSYFKNRSNNQLLNVGFPATVGPGNPVINRDAVIQNSGVEFTLNTQNIKTKHFNWTTSLNLTVNRNKLISYPDLANSVYYATLEVGKPFSGIVQAYQSAGVDPQTGLYQFRTIDGQLTLDPADGNRLDGGKFMRIITDPKFYGGISNTFSYKGLSLDLFFQFRKQTGTDPYSYFRTAVGSKANVPVDFLASWRNIGDVREIQQVRSNYADEYISAIDRHNLSDANYVDASFIKLKNLSMSYTVPTRWKEKLHLKNLRVYIQGQNLWTLTKYKGLDPETQTILSLPPLRVITAGLQITL